MGGGGDGGGGWDLINTAYWCFVLPYLNFLTENLWNITQPNQMPNGVIWWGLHYLPFWLHINDIQDTRPDSEMVLKCPHCGYSFEELRFSWVLTIYVLWRNKKHIPQLMFLLRYEETIKIVNCPGQSQNIAFHTPYNLCHNDDGDRIFVSDMFFGILLN